MIRYPALRRVLMLPFLLAVPVGQAAGVAGSRARLPCLASHDGQPQKPSLVLWYKDRARFPFYT